MWEIQDKIQTEHFLYCKSTAYVLALILEDVLQTINIFFFFPQQDCSDSMCDTRSLVLQVFSPTAIKDNLQKLNMGEIIA